MVSVIVQLYDDMYVMPNLETDIQGIYQFHLLGNAGQVSKNVIGYLQFETCTACCGGFTHGFFALWWLVWIPSMHLPHEVLQFTDAQFRSWGVGFILWLRRWTVVCHSQDIFAFYRMSTEAWWVLGLRSTSQKTPLSWKAKSIQVASVGFSRQPQYRCVHSPEKCDLKASRL